MNDRHQQGLLSAIGALAAWAAAIYLVGCVIGWLLRRKATEWVGMTILSFIPVSFSVAMLINGAIFIAEENPWSDLCSDSLFHAELIIGFLGSVLLGIGVTCDSPEAKRRITENSLNQPATSSGPHKAALKKCTWCGKEYPGEATVCTVDGQQVI